MHEISCSICIKYIPYLMIHTFAPMKINFMDKFFDEISVKIVWKDEQCMKR